MYPFIFPLMYIIIILMVMSQLGKAFPDDIDTIRSKTLNIAFPILVSFGIITSVGVYVFHPVADREQKLRYLLNFAGMRSSSYYIGMFLADIVIYIIPQILLLIMVYVLDLGEVKTRIAPFFVTVVLFAPPFISLIYCFGFIFEKAESAFKYTILLFMLVYIIPLLIGSLVNTTALTNALVVIFPTSTLFTNVQDVMNTNPNAQNEIVYNSAIFLRWIYFFGQTIIFLGIAIFIDNK